MKQNNKQDMSEEEFLNRSLQRNKPRILFPIINTCIAIFLIISIIILQSEEKIKFGFFIFSMFVSILFPLCSWYNSYFSKKKNQKKIYSFQKETEILINFTKKLKGYKIIEITDENNPEYIINYMENIILSKVTFDKESCLINDEKIVGTMISYGISFVGALVDPKTNEVTNIGGMLPRSIWLYRRLNVPKALMGKISVYHSDLANYTIFQSLKDANSYYDKKVVGFALVIKIQMQLTKQ